MTTDYSSPKVWGPHFWYVLRCVANNYPVKPTSSDIKRTKNFYNGIKHVLPCEKCRRAFSKHLKKRPVEKNLSSRNKLVAWVEKMYHETKKTIHPNQTITNFNNSPYTLNFPPNNYIKFTPDYFNPSHPTISSLYRK